MPQRETAEGPTRETRRNSRHWIACLVDLPAGTAANFQNAKGRRF
jgi:hypothetical protein